MKVIQWICKSGSRNPNNGSPTTAPHLQVGKGSRDLILKFLDPLHISGTFGAWNVKFGMHIKHQWYNERNAKFGQRRSGKGHVTYFRNFWTPSISRERLELETSNLACILSTSGSNERNAKFGQRRSGKGHVTYFRNFGTLSISRKRLALETSNVKFFMQIHHQG